MLEVTRVKFDRLYLIFRSIIIEFILIMSVFVQFLDYLDFLYKFWKWILYIDFWGLSCMCACVCGIVWVCFFESLTTSKEEELEIHCLDRCRDQWLLRLQTEVSLRAALLLRWTRFSTSTRSRGLSRRVLRSFRRRRKFRMPRRNTADSSRTRRFRWPRRRAPVSGTRRRHTRLIRLSVVLL